MKLPEAFIQLPMRYDADVLAAEIAALGEAPWRPHPQGFAGNSMLPLLASGGDPANESFGGTMAPTPELERCPYLKQVIASFGATMGRSRLMRLAGQAEVTPHVDQGYYWAERVRVHVPIVTQPTVRFECGGEAIHMAAGECWIFDTWRLHNVINDAAHSRIHLVADTVGGADFWARVARGRAHGADIPGWEPALLAPGATTAPLVCEHVNLPEVMSPWEMQVHFEALFAEVVPGDPALAATRAAVQRLLQAWRGLWARHGDSGSGKDDYRAALQRFVDEVPEGAGTMALHNGTVWFTAAMALVGRMAVKADRPGARVAEYG